MSITENNEKLNNSENDKVTNEAATASSGAGEAHPHVVRRVRRSPRPLGAGSGAPVHHADAAEAPAEPVAEAPAEPIAEVKAEPVVEVPAESVAEATDAMEETKVFEAAEEAPEDDDSKTEVFVSPMPKPEEYDFSNFNFDASLEELTPEDIDPEASGRRSSFPVFAVARVFLILICLAVLGYCLFVIGKTVIDYGRTEAIYDNLAEDFFSLDDNGNSSDNSSRLTQVSIDASVPTADGATGDFVNGGGFVYVPAFDTNDNPFDADPAVMVEKLNKLKERAPDLVGWIYIEGSKINYPVVQYSDNTFYLYHSADKLALQTGAIFEDFRNSRTLSSNYNTVFYGHNIRSGSMFHDVEKMYKNESFFRSTKVVICTFDGIYYYEPVSVFKAEYTAGYNNTDYDGPQDFADYMNYWKNQSMYSNGSPITGTDKILTLSTCTNVQTNERYALMARLTKYDPVK